MAHLFVFIPDAPANARPVVQLVPSLKLGAEVLRDRGYRDDERVTRETMEGYDQAQRICATSRMSPTA